MAHNFATNDLAPYKSKRKGGLGLKGVYAVVSSLPGPESTLEAPASQDAQKDPEVLQFFIMSSYFNTLSECLNNH